MIQWMKPMYRDDNLKESILQIRYNFKFKKYPGSYFFIILPEGKDMPEILCCTLLKQPYYKKVNYNIIGIAASKNGAMQLLCSMIEDAWKKNGSVDIRKYYETFDD